MKLTLPVYIERSPKHTASSVHLVRPLFLEEPIVQDDDLGRALAKFVKSARKILSDAARQSDQQEIARYTFAPDIEEKRIKLRLELKNRMIECNRLLIVFEACGKRVAYAPGLCSRWFEISRGEDLSERASEFLTHHFRDLDESDIDEIFSPGSPEERPVRLDAQSGLVELNIDAPPLATSDQEIDRAKLFGDYRMDGDWELQSVGRCLNDLYPERLSRAINRESELEALRQALKRRDHRPILLLGPVACGKTTLIEEHVYRQCVKRRAAHRNKKNVWLLDPQRLIAGMSYVGQWENRLLSIIEIAKKRKDILYFQDLIGLFSAGVSAQSSLNIGRVIRPFIERREIRVLAEISPDAYRVLRELDRSFSDLFHIIPVKESTEEETHRMMLGVIRDLESNRRCRFDPDVLPAVIGLTRSYQRDAALPGKAAWALHRLAIKYQGAQITRDEAISEFQSRSGLSNTLLTDSRMERGETIARLTESIKGQRAAVEACADILSLAKSRLNDPNRPLASLLFLGPTGVGKTQCAKSLARMLFNSENRLIRFDMNEFISSDAVARLAGGLSHPEGLLTGAIRRQPFSVVLLDEIEKAHPDIFNLLLQVVGDGRLTDSRGRTSDFTQSIIIMTSNLGASEASNGLGFRSSLQGDQSVYIQAAEKFFSPEFFNRIDRIIPFQRLDRKAIREIAREEIETLFERDGFARRKLVLRVDSEALEQILDAGFDSDLGARALKRATERMLAQPIARLLSASPRVTPTVIEILPGAAELKIEVQELIGAALRNQQSIDSLLADPTSAILKIVQYLDGVEPKLAARRPEGPISIDQVNQEHHRYFLLNERVRHLRHNCEWLRRQYEDRERSSSRLGGRKPQSDRPALVNLLSGVGSQAQRDWSSLLSAENLSVFLRETMHLAAEKTDGLQGQLLRAIRETSIVDLSFRDALPEDDQACLILLRSVTASAESHGRLTALYEELFKRHFGFEVGRLVRGNNRARKDHLAWLFLSGRQAFETARNEHGTHLFFENGDQLNPVQVKIIQIEGLLRPRDALKPHLKRIRETALGRSTSDSLLSFDPVIRIYAKDESGIPMATMDLRSGMSINHYPTADNLRTFLISEFAVPKEIFPS